MFSNFKETFVSRPQFTSKIPDAIIELISERLPNGFRYTESNDGICVIDSDSDTELNLSVSIKNLKIPYELHKSQTNSPTVIDVFKYSYNAQEPIEVIPNSDNTYTINNCNIDVNDLVITPLKHMKLNAGRLYIYPHPFPDPVEVELSGDDCLLRLKLQREPIKSINKVKFKSIGTSALNLEIIVSNGQNLLFNVTTNYCNRASEILTSKLLFNSFINGKAKLNGVEIIPSTNINDKLISEEVIDFWKHTVELEKMVGKSFIRPEQINENDISTITMLYESLIKRTPQKKYVEEITLTSVCKPNTEIIGLNGVFKYETHCQIEVFSEKLELLKQTYIYDGIITSVTNDKNENEANVDSYIKISSVENKRMYISVLYSISGEDLIENHNDQQH